MHRQCVLLCMVISFVKNRRFIVGDKVNLAHCFTNCIKIVCTTHICDAIKQNGSEVKKDKICVLLHFLSRYYLGFNFNKFCHILLYGMTFVEEAALVNRQHVEIFLDADIYCLVSCKGNTSFLGTLKCSYRYINADYFVSYSMYKRVLVSTRFQKLG